MKPLRAVIPLPPPALTGPPGERQGRCIAGELKVRGGKRQAVLTFEVVNPATGEVEMGTAWCEMPDPLKPHHRYVRLVREALDDEGDAHPDVFTGKDFIVRVGFRRTEKPGGKGRAADALADRKKDERDFLRVLDVLRRVRS